MGIKFSRPASESSAPWWALAADDAGRRYIISLTDGQPDYCDALESRRAPDRSLLAAEGVRRHHYRRVRRPDVAFDLALGCTVRAANAGAGVHAAPVKTGGSVPTF
jgi:hypothetical protein